MNMHMLQQELTALVLKFGNKGLLLEDENFEEIEFASFSPDLRSIIADHYFDRLVSSMRNSPYVSALDEMYTKQKNSARNSIEIINKLYQSNKKLIREDHAQNGVRLVPIVWSSSGGWRVTIRDETIVSITDEMMFMSGADNDWVENDDFESAIRSLDYYISKAKI